MTRSLFERANLGSRVLANQVVLAPMTRNRADALGVQSEHAAQYYARRAAHAGGAGLLITEGT
jgi:N-ethylmaleimide reductase